MIDGRDKMFNDVVLEIQFLSGMMKTELENLEVLTLQVQSLQSPTAIARVVMKPKMVLPRSQWLVVLFLIHIHGTQHRFKPMHRLQDWVLEHL